MNSSKKTDSKLKAERLVHAIRNDGWNNGFNTDDKPWVDQILELINKERAEARLDETSKWLEIAKQVKVAYAEKGLPPSIPVDSQIRECEKRLEQLKEE